MLLSKSEITSLKSRVIAAYEEGAQGPNEAAAIVIELNGLLNIEQVKATIQEYVAQKSIARPKPVFPPGQADHYPPTRGSILRGHRLPTADGQSGGDWGQGQGDHPADQN